MTEGPHCPCLHCRGIPRPPTAVDAVLLRERFGDPTDLALEYVSRRWAAQPLPGGRMEHTQQRRDRLRQAVVDVERKARG